MNVCKNHIKTDVERIAAAIHIRDAFATPIAISYIPTDPAQILFDERKLRMLSYFVGTDVHKLSDYEQFYEFVSHLDAMQGSAEKEIFLEELISLYGEDALADIKDPETLWKNLCDKMSQENYNFAKKIREISDNNTIKTVRIFSKIKNYNKYSDFVSDQLDEIKNSDLEYATLDISVLNFARIDEFHAAKAYEKYIGGDGGSLSEALSGALYPIMAQLKSSGKTLLLNIEDNYPAAERMIEYFKGRDIMPNTVIFARNASRRVAERLCGVYKSAKGELDVRFGLLRYEGDTVRDIKNRVLDASALYPIGELFIGGALTSSPLLSARHKLLLRGVSEALSELCEDVDECLRVAKMMLK